MTIGEKILNMRKARGWSQEELAERIGVTRQAVSRWEADAAKPDTDKVITICDLFGVSADYLIRDQYSGGSDSGEEQPKPTTAVTEAVRRMSVAQWVGTALMFVGGLLLVILKFVYIAKDTNYAYFTGTGGQYTGYPAFLLTEELVHMHLGAWLAVAAGSGVWLKTAIQWVAKKPDKTPEENG